GNNKTSKSGLNFSGQKSPASPNAKQLWITRHNSKTFMVLVPRQACPCIETWLRFLGEITKVPHPRLGRQKVFFPTLDALRNEALEQGGEGSERFAGVPYQVIKRFPIVAILT